MSNTNTERPQDLLIYYGWLNSFNSVINGWSNEQVAQDMAKYSLIVLGDGIQDPTHGDYANSSIIIPRIMELNPHTQIFGYVTVKQALTSFQTKVDQWNLLKVAGIFMDEAGYDYGTTRIVFNTLVDFVHGRSKANKCFVNAWNMDHILGKTEDPSYPNSIWNSTLTGSHLNHEDWYLLESFPINTAAYAGSSGYEPVADWFARGQKASQKRTKYRINIASVGVIDNTAPNAQTLFDFQFTSAMMFQHQANGSSDINYGAGSAVVTFWTRPDILGLGKVTRNVPQVVVDASNPNVYLKYTEFGRLSADFSPSAQNSSIESW